MHVRQMNSFVFIEPIFGIKEYLWLLNPSKDQQKHSSVHSRIM